SVSKNLWKNFAEPRPAGKNKLSRRNRFPVTARHVRQTPRSPRRLNQGNPKFHAKSDGIFHNCRNRAPRQQHAALRLQKSPRHPFERDLRITPFESSFIHLFKRHLAALQSDHGLAHSRILFARQPQHSRLMKQTLSSRHTKTLPLRERPLGRPRINLVRSITHSNDARLTARTGPRVRRSIRIQEHHALPAPRQMPSAPSPKHPRPNNRRVIGFHSRHSRCILSYLPRVAQASLPVRFLHFSSTHLYDGGSFSGKAVSRALTSKGGGFPCSFIRSRLNG